MLHSCAGAFPRKEGGIEVLAGLAPSSLTVGSLLRISWLVKPNGKVLNNYVQFGDLFHHKNDVS
jgi:hypothetical protein